MEKFKIGTRVIVIDENHEVKGGVINALYHDVQIAIVKFDDGNVEKVDIDCLGIEPKRQEEKPSEPVEKSEVTITPDEFKNIGVRVCMKVTEKNPVSGLLATVVVTMIHEALFYGESDD